MPPEVSRNFTIDAPLHSEFTAGASPVKDEFTRYEGQSESELPYAYQRMGDPTFDYLSEETLVFEERSATKQTESRPRVSEYGALKIFNYTMPRGFTPRGSLAFTKRPLDQGRVHRKCGDVDVGSSQLLDSNLTNDELDFRRLSTFLIE